MRKKFTEVRQEFTIVKDNLVHINACLDTLKRDVAKIRKHFVYRDEFESLVVRIEAIEERLGMKQR